MVLVWGGVVNSQVSPQTTAGKLLDRLTVEDTASALLSLVSFVATPGIRGIDFTVDDEFSGTDITVSDKGSTIVFMEDNIWPVPSGLNLPVCCII